MTTIGEAIRLHRDAAGLTQEELADRISMTQTAVSYWESGKRQPGIDDLTAIARALETTVAALLPPEPQAEPRDDGGRWLRLELLGHRQRAGYVTETTLAGAPMLHIDLPAKLFDGDQGAWEEYAPAALYGVGPATEQEVREDWEREKERRAEMQRWRDEQARERQPALAAGFGAELDDEGDPAGWQPDPDDPEHPF